METRWDLGVVINLQAVHQKSSKAKLFGDQKIIGESMKFELFRIV